MNQRDLFAQKLAKIKSELGPTNLLLVSKTRSLEEIKIYYELGQRDFGENRVQELKEKAQALLETCPEIRWHMIGHLQSNKVNQLYQVPHLHAIHSVDDEDLVKKLVASEHLLKKDLDIFLQLNTSGEGEKSGFESFEELRKSAEFLFKSTHLKLKGLMTMGTLRTDHFQAEALRCFKQLNQDKERLEKELNLKLQTSMGMSQDYHLALKEHSDWVRLGTMMFE